MAALHVVSIRWAGGALGGAPAGPGTCAQLSVVSRSLLFRMAIAAAFCVECSSSCRLVHIKPRPMQGSVGSTGATLAGGWRRCQSGAAAPGRGQPYSKAEFE